MNLKETHWEASIPWLSLAIALPERGVSLKAKPWNGFAPARSRKLPEGVFLVRIFLPLTECGLFFLFMAKPGSGPCFLIKLASSLPSMSRFKFGPKPNEGLLGVSLFKLKPASFWVMPLGASFQGREGPSFESSARLALDGRRLANFPASLVVPPPHVGILFCPVVAPFFSLSQPSRDHTDMRPPPLHSYPTWICQARYWAS